MRPCYGIDIVEVSRVKNIVTKRKKQLKKLFTEKETKYCLSKKNPYPHFASRFAAKEAFLKAVSSGWQGKLKWTDMEVRNDKFGKPEIIILPGKKLAFMKKIKSVSLTISQDKNYAVAMVAIGG
ncbi:MAG: holo-ACP synthase [Candidatus Firestonebacteria bacterium]